MRHSFLGFLVVLSTALATTACANDSAPRNIGCDGQPIEPGVDVVCAKTPNGNEISGSYLLVFESVTAADAKTTPGLPLREPRASIGNEARIDLDGSKSAAPIVQVTPRWGETAKLDSRVSASTLTLDGKLTFAASGERNEWTSLTLDRDADGFLTLAFTATGLLTVVAGDVIESYAVTGKGHLRGDDVAPEARLAPPLRSRGGSWLPWDRVALELAEPLAQAGLLPPLQKVLPEVTWTPTSLSSSAADALATGWAGKSASFEVGGSFRLVQLGEAMDGGRVPASVDPSGNALGPFSDRVAFRDVGAAAERHDYDLAASGATWGDLARVNDSRCEKGGCLVFPATRTSSCVTPSGLAGRLTRSSTITRVHARVRVLAADDATDATTPPVVYQPIRLEVSTPRGQAFYGKDAPIELVRTAEDPALPWATAWTTIDVDVLDVGTEVGFDIVRPACEAQGGGPPFPDANVSVIVDSVWGD